MTHLSQVVLRVNLKYKNLRFKEKSIAKAYLKITDNL